MTKTFYGVDSVTNAAQVAPLLLTKWGTLPSWWARYIGGSWAIDPAELAWDRTHGVRTVFVFNALDGSTTTQDHAAGAACATRAIAALVALGLDPRHCLTFLDIESSWQTNPDFLLGWAETMAAHGVPGGFYANTEWDAFNVPYAGIVAKVARRYRLIWASEPQTVGYVPPPGPTWAAMAPPSDPSASVLWQFHIDGAETNRLVDLDLATEEAYGLMLGAPLAPAPTTFRVKDACSLKAVPSHLDAELAHDEHRRPVTLPRGSEVVKGAITITDDTWIAVSLPERTVHGYILLKNIVEDAL